MKVISINIERDLHENTVIPFLKEEKPDVICMQEVFEDKIASYQKELNVPFVFMPMVYWDSSLNCRENKGLRKIGIVIFAKNIEDFNFKYIVGDENKIPVFKQTLSIEERNVINILAMWVVVSDKNNNNKYTFVNTHFTWTKDGLSTEYQKEDAKKLIDILNNNLDEFTLVGDLNAPRGGETFALFQNDFKDNIPKEYKTSLDQNLHRVKGLEYVVDCFFTKGNFKVKSVKLVDGVSDHMAVVGEIE